MLDRKTKTFISKMYKGYRLKLGDEATEKDFRERLLNILRSGKDPSTAATYLQITQNRYEFRAYVSYLFLRSKNTEKAFHMQEMV